MSIKQRKQRVRIKLRSIRTQAKLHKQNSHSMPKTEYVKKWRVEHRRGYDDKLLEIHTYDSEQEAIQAWSRFRKADVLKNNYHTYPEPFTTVKEG